jgi:MoxR-like ATPase
MTTIQDSIQALRGSLRGQFIDRDDAIDGILAALLADEHVFLLGPPGTGKSALAAAVCKSIKGGKTFNVLLTKTTVPDEVWGPVDLMAFDQGRFERRTENYLPTATVAFLDELWRGSSPILNGLLRAVNERVYEHNGKLKKLPLRMVIGASNSLPESNDLDALYDRFALRFVIGRVKGRMGRDRLLRMKGHPTTTASLTLKDLDAARAEVNAVQVSDAMFDRLLSVWDDLSSAGHDISERRWRQLVKLLRAKAYLEGRSEIEPADLTLVADSGWYDPKDRHDILSRTLKIGAPSVARGIEVLDLAKTVLDEIPKHDGDNDAKVATAAGKAKKRIAELLDDLQTLEDQAIPGELPKLQSIRREVGDLRRDAIRIMQAVVNA